MEAEMAIVPNLSAIEVISILQKTASKNLRDIYFNQDACVTPLPCKREIVTG